MATAYSTTNTAPGIYPSTTLIDRHRTNGNLYVMAKDSTANQYGLYRSTNNGGSWSSYANFSRSNLAEMGSIFIGKDHWVRLVYRVQESSLDKIYIRGLNTATGVWEPELLLGSAASGTYFGVDVWQTVSGGTEYYCVAVGTVVGASHGVTLLGAYTTPIPGTTVADNSVISGKRQWLVTGSGRITPSIDANHNGDGKSASNPHLRIAFGRTSALIVYAGWNGDGWTGPSSPITLASGLTAHDFMPARWDGLRFLVATKVGSTVVVYERNASNTSHATRTSPTHSQGVVRTHAINYNTSTGDFRVYAVGTTINDLYYVEYDRSADSWGGWVAVTATDVLGANVDNWGLRRSTYGNSRYDTLVAHSGAPNTVVHYQPTVVYTPLPGVWRFEGLAHTNGGARVWNTTLPINWTFVDTDPGSSQTAYAVRRQIGAGAFAYWRASDSTWQAAEVKNMTSANFLTVPANWAGSAAEAVHTLHLKTWNSADQTSGYTGEAFTLTPSARVNPVITFPLDASTVTTSTITVTWTAAEQIAYSVKTFIFGVLLQDSGKVLDSVSRSYVSPEVYADGFNYSIQVKTWNLENLDSDVIQSNISIDFIAPMTPTLVVTPSTEDGWNSVAITNPAPSGGAPAVAYQDLFRRIVGEAESIRVASGLASGATFDDWRAVHGVPYEYQSYVVGDTGATATSAWTA